MGDTASVQTILTVAVYTIGAIFIGAVLNLGLVFLAKGIAEIFFRRGND